MTARRLAAFGVLVPLLPLIGLAATVRLVFELRAHAGDALAADRYLAEWAHGMRRRIEVRGS